MPFGAQVSIFSLVFLKFPLFIKEVFVKNNLLFTGRLLNILTVRLFILKKSTDGGTFPPIGV